MDAFLQGLAMVFNLQTMLVIVAAAVFGLFVGAIPGLTATMAVALLVPITFYMDATPAIAAIVAPHLYPGRAPSAASLAASLPSLAAVTQPTVPSVAAAAAEGWQGDGRDGGRLKARDGRRGEGRDVDLLAIHCEVSVVHQLARHVSRLREASTKNNIVEP